MQLLWISDNQITPNAGEIENRTALKNLSNFGICQVIYVPSKNGSFFSLQA